MVLGRSLKYSEKVWDQAGNPGVLRMRWFLSLTLIHLAEDTVIFLASNGSIKEAKKAKKRAEKKMA